MWGRSQSPAERLSDALGDVKTGATVGAVKGAAAGALGVLGSKASGAARNVAGNNGDLGTSVRKAQKGAAKTLSQASGNAKKQAAKADVQGKANAAGGLLQTLGSRVGSAAQDAQKNASSGLNINIDAADIPRLVRGATLLATGIGTLFAPGSPLDASRRQAVDGDELVDQTRQGIDAAADLTQQRIKDLTELAKDTLSALSDALTSGIETAEDRAEQALDEAESRLTKATSQAADTAKDRLPKQKKGGTVRWLFVGLLVGGAAAFLSSPLSGPLGERVNNLRRDLGLGGDAGDDSQYWPSPPQSTSTTTTTTAEGGADASPVDMKTEAWSTPAEAKQDTDKA